MKLRPKIAGEVFRPAVDNIFQGKAPARYVPPDPEWGKPELDACIEPDGLMWVRCWITDPPSSAGREVTMVVPAEMMPALLRLAREAAVSARGGTS
jgi:hypothetical protein